MSKNLPKACIFCKYSKGRSHIDGSLYKIKDALYDNDNLACSNPKGIIIKAGYKDDYCLVADDAHCEHFKSK